MIEKIEMPTSYRRILFRGRVINSPDWIEGSLIQVGACHLIWSEDQDGGIEVEPGSVGQYTGKQDIKDEPIFEGDLVNVRIPWTRVSLPMDLGVHRVEFVDGAFVLTDHTGSKPICGYAPTVQMEVVGRAYDRLEEVTENGGQDD